MHILDASNLAVLDTAVQELTDDALLPVVLARACVAVLPVQGASLSLSSGLLRVPLGASDQAAARAETLQFTQGDGPCLAVYRSQPPTRASSTDMQRQWPTYYAALVDETPYRSAASVPLLAGGKLVGALDVYSHDENGRDTDTLQDAVTVPRSIVTLLNAGLNRSAYSSSNNDADADAADADDTDPEWLHGPTAGQRSRTWIAVGIVRAALSLNAMDALDLIRAYA